MGSWAMNHPFLALFIYLCAEALLPVRFQPSTWVCRGLIRAYQITLSAHVQPLRPGLHAPLRHPARRHPHHLAPDPLLAADQGRCGPGAGR